MYTKAKVWEFWELAVVLYCRDKLKLQSTAICINLNRTPGAIKTRLHKFDTSNNMKELSRVQSRINNYSNKGYNLEDIKIVIKDKGLMHDVLHLKIKFELGDLVECPYYNFRGFIDKFNVCDGITYVNLKNRKGNECSTRITQWSSNAVLPCYLRMICKAKDINKVLNNALGI